MDLCTRMYVLATIEYSKTTIYKKNHISQIHFLDINIDTVKDIQDMFSEALEKGADVSPKYQTYLGHKKRGREVSRYNSREDQVYKDDGNADMDRQLKLEKLRPEVYNVKGSLIKIIVKTGNIAKAQTDAVVVAVDQTGNGGKLVKSVEGQMKQNMISLYHQELSAKFIQSIKTGRVLSTGGCGSNFGQVLHAVIPFGVRMQPNREWVLCNVYNNILLQLQSNQSVATVLLGISKY